MDNKQFDAAGSSGGPWNLRSRKKRVSFKNDTPQAYTIFGTVIKTEPESDDDNVKSDTIMGKIIKTEPESDDDTVKAENVKPENLKYETTKSKTKSKIILAKSKESGNVRSKNKMPETVMVQTKDPVPAMVKTKESETMMVETQEPEAEMANAKEPETIMAKPKRSETSRRNIFKKNPYKTPTRESATVSVSTEELDSIVAKILQAQKTQQNQRSHSATITKDSEIEECETSRRSSFKKNPYKAARSIFIPISEDKISYYGSYFTIGDVVSVVDSSQNVYYAQIRGLLQSQYGEKSAVLTWLLPTQSSPLTGFDPDTFILGPEEDIPRGLECLEFVCHSPSEYFKCTNFPHSQVPQKPVCAYAQTSRGHVIVQLPTEELSDSD